MKLRLVNILIFSCLALSRLSAQTDSENISPKILIIDSYSIEVEWANNVSGRIEEKLLEIYPQADIHVGYLNIDMASSSNIPQLALRDVLWAFVEEKADQKIAESLSARTIFSSGIYPDVIVFVGIDGLLFYQNYGPILNQWKDIPLVLCTVNSNVINEYLSDYQIEERVPVEERRTTQLFLSEAHKAIMTDGTANLTPHKEGDVSGYLLTQNFNLTGVKSTLPVKENLELIFALMPDLQEIVWIDSDYYSSKYVYKRVEQELKKFNSNVKLSTTKHNKINSDSIFNVILQDVPDRVFLTYAWSINGIYSKHSDMFIRDVFTERTSVPLFSLTEPSFTDGYWVGGYYITASQLAEKTIEQVTRILNGEAANSISFEVIGNDSLILDQTLLKKYGLERRVLNNLTNVQYKNIPPSFFEKHEKKIYGATVFLIIVVGLYLFLRMRNKQNLILKEEAERYKRLSDMLRVIYNYALTDFAVYDDSGSCVFSNVNDENSGQEYKKLFSDNIFENPYLTAEQRQSLRNGENINIEIGIESSDKFSSSFVDRDIYQLIMSPLNGQKYHIAHYLMLVVNKTPVMRERTERERFETLFDFASGFSEIGMAFYDLKTRNVTATRSWYDNLEEQVKPGTLPGYKAVFNEDRITLLEFRERMKRGYSESYIGDIRVKDKDGQQKWIRQYLYSHPSNKQIVIELNINIDQSKEREKKLQEAKRMADLTTEETKHFLSSINHEIRTPLNSIVGFSAFLAVNENNDEYKEYIKLIDRSNLLLTNLMDDIIVLSNLDAGQVSFSSDKVNLNVIFADWAKYCTTFLFGKDLQIICDVPQQTTIIETDFYYFSKLMLNLLMNAIKFTESGSVVFGYRSEKDYFYFYVKDTGCGIDSSHQQLIFKRFTKLNTFAQGTGLGLALCKRISEKLGGKIGVNSKPGVGSTFWFTIPKQSI